MLLRKVKTMEGLAQMRQSLQDWIRESAKFATMLEMNSIGELAPRIGVGATTLPDSLPDN